MRARPERTTQRPGGVVKGMCLTCLARLSALWRRLVRRLMSLGAQPTRSASLPAHWCLGIDHLLPRWQCRTGGIVSLFVVCGVTLSMPCLLGRIRWRFVGVPVCARRGIGLLALFQWGLRSAVGRRCCLRGFIVSLLVVCGVTLSMPCLLGRIGWRFVGVPVCGVGLLALFRWGLRQRAAFEEAVTMGTASEVLAGPFQNALDPALGRLRV